MCSRYIFFVMNFTKRPTSTKMIRFKKTQDVPRDKAESVNNIVIIFEWLHQLGRLQYEQNGQNSIFCVWTTHFCTKTLKRPIFTKKTNFHKNYSILKKSRRAERYSWECQYNSYHLFSIASVREVTIRTKWTKMTESRALGGSNRNKQRAVKELMECIGMYWNVLECLGMYSNV